MLLLTIPPPIPGSSPDDMGDPDDFMGMFTRFGITIPGAAGGCTFGYGMGIG